MKNRLVFTALFCYATLCLYAQCDSGSEPECQCETAEVLCSVGELDGFSSSMSSFQHPDDGPDGFCPPTGLFSNNPTWFAFIAWCDDIAMEVEYSDCTTVGGFTGAQLAVYTDCSLDEQVDCDSECTNNSTVSIDLSGLTIGESYYVFLDGCNGSACDFEISVSPTDCDEFIEDWDEPVTEDLVVCLGQEVIYDVDELQGATSWHWFLDGDEVEITDVASYTILWDQEGKYELCVDVSNICLEVDEEPEQNCVMITVGDPDAGEIDINDSPECPNEFMEVTVSNYNMGEFYDQYVIITDMEGEVVQIISGNPIIDFTWPSCGMFTVYSLNFPDDEEIEVPDIGDDYSGSDCMLFCCNETSSTLEFVDEEPPEFEDDVDDVTIDCHLLLEELDLDDLESIDVDDNCAEDFEVLGMETIMADTCNGGTIVRQWMFADDCGNEVSQTQTITILPLQMPQFLNPPSDTSMSNLEYENYIIPQLQYTNGQGGSCQISGIAMPVIEDNRSGCGGFVLLSYSYTDLCDREIVASQRITIETDVMATDTTLNICDVDAMGFVILDQSEIDQIIANDLTGLSIGYYPTKADLDAGVNQISFPVNTQSLPEQRIYADVLDASGCQSEIIVSISINPLPILELEAQDESCLGFEDGVINILNPADLSRYTLQESADTILGNSIGELAVGTYVFTLIDSLGCSIMDSASIAMGIQLSFTNVTQVCDINGTGTDDTDDFYEITLIVVGGTGTYQLDIGNMVNQGTYNYNETVNLTLPADGSTLNLVALDSEYGCAAEFTLDPLLPCSNQCALNLDLLEYICNDNDTPLDSSDDYFDFSISVSAINPGTTGSYDVYVDNILSFSFNYGDQASFELPASGSEVLFRIEDQEISNCGLDVISESLDACSDLCQLTLSVVSVFCLDPGTPSVNEDDLFEVQILVEGINASNTYDIIDERDQLDYGQFVILGNNLIQDGDLIIQVVDSEDSACMDEAVVSPPPPCSSPCDITIAELEILDCNDNMTGMDTGDDFFSIMLTVDSLLGTGTEYTLSDGMSTYGPYNYGISYEIGTFPAVGTDINLELNDAFNETCFIEFSISQNPCSICDHILDLTADILILDCVDTESQIESTGDATIVDYNWEGPGGFVSNSADLTISNAGTYTLTVEFDDGCVLTESIEIESSTETPISNAGVDMILNCDISSVTLSSELSQYGNNVQINWLDEMGNLISNETEITVQDPGIYGLLLVDTVNRCESETDFVSVVELLNEPLAVIYAEPTSILDCNITSIRLTYEEEVNTVYSWLINNQTIQNDELIIEEPQNVGLLALDTVSRCETESSLMITDFEIYPEIIIDNIETLDCITASACVSITSNAANAVQYAWYDSGGSLLSNDENEFCFDVEGTYTVEITDIENGCQNTESFIIEGPTLPLVSLPSSVTIVNDIQQSLNATINVNENFLSEILWESDATLSCYDCLNTIILAAQDSSIVTVTITTIEGCTDQAQVLVNVERIPKIYIPNIASSESRENFTIFTSPDIDRIDELVIYDRWGNLIFSNMNFEPNDQSQGWDGTRDGRPVEQGVYVYYLVYKVNGREEKIVGSLTLVK